MNLLWRLPCRNDASLPLFLPLFNRMPQELDTSLIPLLHRLDMDMTVFGESSCFKTHHFIGGNIFIQALKYRNLWQQLFNELQKLKLQSTTHSNRWCSSSPVHPWRLPHRSQHPNVQRSWLCAYACSSSWPPWPHASARLSRRFSLWVRADHILEAIALR